MLKFMKEVIINLQLRSHTENYTEMVAAHTYDHKPSKTK